MKYHVIVHSYGSVYVEADSENEAMNIVSGLNHESFDWSIPENFEVFASDDNKELSKEEAKNVACTNEKAEGGELMFVTHYVIGTFVSEVMASGVEEAIKKADKKINSTDFGELCCIDTEVTLVENEDGEYLFEK